MTKEEAIQDIEKNILPVVGGKSLRMAVNALKQPERKKGKWVIEPDRTVMHCNVCGWAFEYYAGLEEEWNYCPHCGADMRGET